MTRFSSINGEAAYAACHERRARMVVRLLAHPPEPLAEDGLALRILETRGRASGRSRYTPLGVLQSGGSWWLIAPERGRDWVRNLLAHPGCAVMAGNQYHARNAVPIEDRQGAVIVARYLSVASAPWARQAFPVGPNTAEVEIVAHMPAMAVFRLDRAERVDEQEGGSA